MMANRPQTLYGIADSPVGLAAWILDHDVRSYELIARVFRRAPRRPHAGRLLDNITLYLADQHGVSSARLYRENKLPFFARRTSPPGRGERFSRRGLSSPRSWAERAYPKLIYYNKLDKGGHFAAWEQPKLLVGDLREGFESLRG